MTELSDIHPVTAVEVLYQVASHPLLVMCAAWPGNAGAQNSRGFVFTNYSFAMLQHAAHEGTAGYAHLDILTHTGYVVHCGVRSTTGVHYIYVIVQSARDAAFLEDRIFAFMASVEVGCYVDRDLYVVTRQAFN